MKYYLIAGEASGDLHASHLMAALRKEDPEARFRLFGGDMMKCQSDSLSTGTVTYYFDKATLAPVAAEYNVDMQIDQKMDMYITKTGEQSNISTLTMAFDISTNISNYFFFGGWFD